MLKMKAVQEHYRMILVTKTKGVTEGDSKYAKIPSHHSASFFFSNNCTKTSKIVVIVINMCII